jgi:mono/diheme cytochrome c family protein
VRRVVLAAAGVLALAGCGGGPSGQRVFAASCAGCHAGRNPPGGDLRDMRLTAAEVESFARIMPVRRPLSDAELRAVSSWIAARER